MDAPKTKFLKVKCKDCENEQIIFGSATSKVDCAVCGSTLAEPRGGKAVIKSQILEVLD
ncbi:MAG: 30S ribosomal protein S27e [Methanocella sp.]|jgi:small subunit ribosomal protein S27e